MGGKIAIIGLSALLPENKNAGEFWGSLLQGHHLTAKAGVKEFRKDPAVFFHPSRGQVDKTYCLGGAFVKDFQFNAEGYETAGNALAELDPLFHWALHTSKEALQQSGYWQHRTALDKCGLIVGNLSFPTRTSRSIVNSLYAKVLSKEINELAAGANPDLLSPAGAENYYNVFSGERISHVTATALGVRGRHFALDAACSSALYAIKVAGDYLLSGKQDMMLAGAVSCADPVFINMGFSYYHAFPDEHGVSSPFESASGGLTPAEGAGFVVLKRYEDAVSDKDNILAVIHGTGLSNDGRGKFLLSPQSKGQIESFNRAYRDAAIAPEKVAYVECHATGTPVGDVTELDSLSAFFARDNFPLLGAVKSNTGHLLTAAGIPGIVKVINSLQTGTIPATIGIQQALGMGDKIVKQNLPWPQDKEQLAGISAFGFGGTNAHMVIGAPGPMANQPGLKKAGEDKGELAVTGWDVLFGEADGIHQLNHVITNNKVCKRPLPKQRWYGLENQADLLKAYKLEAAPGGNFIEAFDFDNLRYKILPREANKIVAQQLLILRVADRAIKQAGIAAGENIGVIIAMQPELALHKYLGRRDMDWQLREALEAKGCTAESIDAFIQKAKDFIFELSADNNSASTHTGVTGNLMACRISSLWDFTGPALTVSSGEDSFIKVLELAQVMVDSGVCDGVVVGAVDISGEYEHLLLRNKFDQPVEFPGEGAAAFVLQPAEKITAKEKIWATIKDVTIVDHMAPGKLSAFCTTAVQQLQGARLHYLEFAGRARYNNEFVSILGKELPAAASGAVTDNIGHTFSASGAASLAKALLLLNQRPEREVNAPVLIATLCSVSQSFSLTKVMGAGNLHLLQDLPAAGEPKKSPARIQTGGPGIEHFFKKEQMNKTVKENPQATAIKDTFTFEEAKAGKMPVLKKEAQVIWNEKDLLEFAGGSIAKVFGDEYKIIDIYERKVRLPLPPYLLVSRVTQLNAKTGEFRPSTMTTEYDIPYNAWYSVDGQAPWAVSVESGQCDLMLISYLGIDFENKGERIYRLLDCTLTFLDELPKEGQTLRYEISINSFVRSGANLLFFFSYNCFVGDKMVLKMTNGCAGFFSDQELQEGQGVVRSNRETGLRNSIKKKHFVPVKNTTKRSFSKEDLIHLVNGKPELCFGPSYGHQWRNPSLRLPSEPLLMIDRVTKLDPAGGPWGLGLIEAEKDLHPDDWYFPCHFKSDEVLAGSLQAEGGGQLLQFYMLFLGLHGLTKDARFQPVEGLGQKVRCRKQVTPKNTKLTYRMEIKAISLLPTPSVISDVEILTEDGIVAVHFENLGLRLKEKDASYLLVTPKENTKPVLFSEEQLSNYALGSLVKIFGSEFEPFETRVLSRQPNTDLQVVSRIVSFSGQRHKFTGQPFVIAEYDVPLHPWYYTGNSSPVIPYSVLMEIALQPCGVLTAHLGSTFIYPDKDVFFRNLDGEGTLSHNTDLRGKTIVNKAVLTSSTAFEGNIIQKFTYEMSVEGAVFYRGTAAFGFFPQSSLVDQVGLDRGEVVLAWHERMPASFSKKVIDLNSLEGVPLFQARNEKKYLRLSGPQLHFLDTLIYVENGGNHGKGYVYGQKKIDPSDWFYNCHFYQDPVMPGSLGVEAMLQAMQGFALLKGLGRHFRNPCFSHEEQHQTKWKYRGQIIPDNKFMSLEIHITAITETNDLIIIQGEGSLWKEDIRIYELSGLSLAIREMI